MKTMYKAYENNPRLEVVYVTKDTGKTVYYLVKKFSIGNDLTGVITGEALRKERKESDWYKYFNSKQEAKDWLLVKIEARRCDALEELNRVNATKNEILDMNI
jgi:hypothetical protein